MSIALEEVDPIYVELEAQRREIAWRDGAEERARARARARERRTLGRRIDVALATFTLTSTVPAASLQPRVTGSVPDSTVPPPADVPEGVRVRHRLIEAHVVVIEREVDAYLGRAEPAELVRMTTEAKNAYLLTALAGVPATAVARDFPELGSSRTIERVRRAAGLRPSTGLVP